MAQWHGQAHLDYGVKAEKTQILSSFSQAPFKLQRPFYPEKTGVCHSVLVHTAGGIVGGDRLSIQLNLQPQAHALVTTSAASKLYRSAQETAAQSLHITLDSGAILEWLPQETIVFNGAHFTQDIQVSLQPGSVWVSMELYRFGRTARGEHFDQGIWRSHAQVWQGSTPLWIDRSRLQGSWSQNDGTLGSASVMGTLVVLGCEISRAAIAQIREEIFSLPSPACRIGMSRHPAGVICRYLGHSTTEGRTYFLKIWKNLRQIYAGCDMCIPRVWQASMD